MHLTLSWCLGCTIQFMLTILITLSPLDTPLILKILHNHQSCNCSQAPPSCWYIIYVLTHLGLGDLLFYTLHTRDVRYNRYTYNNINTKITIAITILSCVYHDNYYSLSITVSDVQIKFFCSVVRGDHEAIFYANIVVITPPF